MPREATDNPSRQQIQVRARPAARTSHCLIARTGLERRGGTARVSSLPPLSCETTELARRIQKCAQRAKPPRRQPTSQTARSSIMACSPVSPPAPRLVQPSSSSLAAGGDRSPPSPSLFAPLASSLVRPSLRFLAEDIAHASAAHSRHDVGRHRVREHLGHREPESVRPDRWRGPALRGHRRATRLISSARP